MTPAKFVESVRVDAACRALETTDVGADVIAKACGFGTAETMRRTFARTKGIAPSDYRSRFAFEPPDPSGKNTYTYELRNHQCRSPPSSSPASPRST